MSHETKVTLGNASHATVTLENKSMMNKNLLNKAFMRLEGMPLEPIYGPEGIRSEVISFENAKSK
jgi:hypothetical protein